MSSNLKLYVDRFGLRRGLETYARTKWARGSIEIKVPGLSAPVMMRTGTSDRRVFQHIFLKGGYDTPYPGRPRLIIDAGANNGYSAVRFASLYPEADIVAVEPDRANIAALERNIATYPRVRVVRAAVWPRDVPLTIENPTDRSWSFRVRPARDGEPSFPAVSIVSLLRDSGHTAIDILKLDVEGAERELFEDPDCDLWLARTNMLFVETHDRHRPGCEAALAAAAARHSFLRTEAGANVVLVRDRLVE